ncbi:MAG: endonuclease/exonuclease/phosphatase family protein [Hyphomicrobiaceae bacterium]
MRYGLPFNTKDFTEEQTAEWSESFRDQKFNEAVDKVAPVIAKLDADVLLLQEVGNQSDTQALRTKISALGLSYPHIFVCRCTDTTTTQHVAVFSRIKLENTVPLIQGREGYYQEDDDANTERETGLSKSLKVVFKIRGQTVHFFGLHLKSERGFSEADNQRIAQASIVRRTYLPLLTSGQHVIVAGDFNDGRGQPALRRLRGFDDIGPDLIQTGNKNFFPEAKWDQRWTHVFEGVRGQIDHILISRSLRSAFKVEA